MNEIRTLLLAGAKVGASATNLRIPQVIQPPPRIVPSRKLVPRKVSRDSDNQLEITSESNPDNVQVNDGLADVKDHATELGIDDVNATYPHQLASQTPLAKAGTTAFVAKETISNMINQAFSISSVAMLKSTPIVDPQSSPSAGITSRAPIHVLDKAVSATASKGLIEKIGKGLSDVTARVQGQNNESIAIPNERAATQDYQRAESQSHVDNHYPNLLKRVAFNIEQFIIHPILEAATRSRSSFPRIHMGQESAYPLTVAHDNSSPQHAFPQSRENPPLQSSQYETADPIHHSGVSADGSTTGIIYLQNPISNVLASYATRIASDLGFIKGAHGKGQLLLPVRSLIRMTRNASLSSRGELKATTTPVLIDRGRELESSHDDHTKADSATSKISILSNIQEEIEPRLLSSESPSVDTQIGSISKDVGLLDHSPTISPSLLLHETKRMLTFGALSVPNILAELIGRKRDGISSSPKTPLRTAMNYSIMSSRNRQERVSSVSTGEYDDSSTSDPSPGPSVDLGGAEPSYQRVEKFQRSSSAPIVWDETRIQSYAGSTQRDHKSFTQEVIISSPTVTVSAKAAASLAISSVFHQGNNLRISQMSPHATWNADPRDALQKEDIDVPSNVFQSAHLGMPSPGGLAVRPIGNRSQSIRIGNSEIERISHMVLSLLNHGQHSDSESGPSLHGLMNISMERKNEQTRPIQFPDRLPVNKNGPDSRSIDENEEIRKLKARIQRIIDDEMRRYGFQL